MNYLIIESLQKFHHYYGDDFRVECPTGSGQLRTIDQIGDEIASRLERLFLKDEHGVRPVLGQYPQLQSDPHFRDYVLFHSTSTATPAAVSAPRTRLAGPAWSRSC